MARQTGGMHNRATTEQATCSLRAQLRLETPLPVHDDNSDLLPQLAVVRPAHREREHLFHWRRTFPRCSGHHHYLPTTRVDGASRSPNILLRFPNAATQGESRFFTQSASGLPRTFQRTPAEPKKNTCSMNQSITRNQAGELRINSVEKPLPNPPRTPDSKSNRKLGRLAAPYDIAHHLHQQCTDALPSFPPARALEQRYANTDVHVIGRKS